MRHRLYAYLSSVYWSFSTADVKCWYRKQLDSNLRTPAPAVLFTILSYHRPHSNALLCCGNLIELRRQGGDRQPRRMTKQSHTRLIRPSGRRTYIRAAFINTIIAAQSSPTIRPRHERLCAFLTQQLLQAFASTAIFTPSPYFWNLLYSSIYAVHFASHLAVHNTNQHPHFQSPSITVVPKSDRPTRGNN